MYYVIPYIRSRYSVYSQLSKEKITDYFMKLDSNSDGYLSPFEFKHLVSASSNWEGSKLTNDEVDAVVEVLDVVSNTHSLCLLAYSLTYLLTHSLTHSLTDLLPHSLVYWLTHLPPPPSSPSYSLPHLLTHLLLTHSPPPPLTHPLPNSLTHSLGWRWLFVFVGVPASV